MEDIRENHRYPKLTISEQHCFNKIIDEELTNISPRERKVLKMRLGLITEEPMSPKEIAKEFNVCVNYIYQIEARINRILKRRSQIKKHPINKNPDKKEILYTTDPAFELNNDNNKQGENNLKNILDKIEEPTNMELRNLEEAIDLNNDNEVTNMDFSRTQSGKRRSSNNLNSLNVIYKPCNFKIIDNPIEDLNLEKRTVTELNKNNVFTIADLISKTRNELKSIKFIGAKGSQDIADALLKKDLVLEGDEVFECSKCSKQFVVEEGNTNTIFCPLCQLKNERISKISTLKVSLMPPEYSSYTNLGEGFHLTVNIKNDAPDKIQTISIKDFYIISMGRQFSPNCFLSGYSFSEEEIWPMTTRSCAKIWDIKEFNKKKLSDGDYCIITLKSPEVIHMFKFVLDSDNWMLDDYFKTN